MGRLALLALVATLAACVSDGRPANLDCAKPAISLSAALSKDVLDPSALAACRGQQVSLAVKIGQDGVLHIHGYGSSRRRSAPERPRPLTSSPARPASSSWSCTVRITRVAWRSAS